MTRLRMGSGGSALSLAFAAGLAAAGGFGATTVPVFATGGAGVLPSTGSAIFPLLDLSISIINRDYRRTKLLETVYRYNFLYFRNPLSVKANSDFRSYLCTCFGLCRYGTSSVCNAGLGVLLGAVAQGAENDIGQCGNECGRVAHGGHHLELLDAQLERLLAGLNIDFVQGFDVLCDECDRDDEEVFYA